MLNLQKALLFVVSIGSLIGCASSPKYAGKRFSPHGDASWYGNNYQGRRTASGETFDMHKMTAAHPTLPFGTRVRVESVSTKKAVTVRINDRGPAQADRIIDLSFEAARRLGMVNKGHEEVRISVITDDN